MRPLNTRIAAETSCERDNQAQVIRFGLVVPQGMAGPVHPTAALGGFICQSADFRKSRCSSTWFATPLTPLPARARSGFARAARASLGGRETDAVVLEVSDTGNGIPPEVEKRLFDPFFSTKETGTGLGLPIAARIVEKHGGMLQYQTRPGHGTTFGVVLPREINDTAERATK